MVNSNRAYLVSRTLHWICAFLYIFLAVSMPIALDLADTGEQRRLANDIHLTVAFLFLVILIFRFGWMYSTKENGLRTEFAYKWQYYMARVNHTFLYALMILSPLSGIISKLFTGKPVVMYGYTILDNMRSWKDRDIVYYASEIHSYAIETFYILIALHLLGTLVHLLHKVKDKKHA